MRYVVIAFILILSFVLQSTLFEYIRIFNVAPNLLVMIVVSFALLRGAKEGVVIGFAGGLLYDTTYSVIVGSSAISYMILGYVCGKLHPYCFRENNILPFMCTLFGSLFISAMNLIGFILRADLEFVYFLPRVVIPELLYTITLTLVVYHMSYTINEKIEMREKKTRNLF
ncbi:MAG: rod shape-determining protein MreD [Epulopiscium sp. Nuni2H_MBin003]|nr:MAG: rod shape-determining protein MreD [Epulopiscium sp. Nuni2H_MBin003]